MISLHTYRQHVEAFVAACSSYIDLLKQSKLNNVTNKSAQSDEYLSAVAINCILSEVQKIFEKKLVTTKGTKMKFEFTDAQGVVLYKTLLLIPIDSDKVFLQMLISDWIQQLDQEIILNHIYHQHQVQAHDAATSWTDYFGD